MIKLLSLSEFADVDSFDIEPTPLKLAPNTTRIQLLEGKPRRNPGFFCVYLEQFKQASVPIYSKSNFTYQPLPVRVERGGNMVMGGLEPPTSEL